MKNITMGKRLMVSFTIMILLNALVCYCAVTTFDQMLSMPNPEYYAKAAKTAVSIIGLIIIIFGAAVEMSILKVSKASFERVTEAANKISRGEVDVKLEKLNNDEFGVLMDAMNEMVAGIREQAEVAEQIAHGNLTVDITPRSDKDVLGKALKELINDNNRMFGGIRESSMQVMTGADQVASASQSLAQGSTEQASALEQINASIDEIAEKTKVNATQANDANELVQDAKQGAVRGNAQMQEMICAMNEINQASENISKIIKVIDDISFQTNILALNAAVEAARAGEHGKGFAVVAEEVRNLAAKSSSAASETAEMIEDSIRKVENGAKLAEETAAALDEIVAAVDKIVSLISSIAVSSSEQATAVAQIDQAINQVSQVVQTNSATSEQCAAASEELSNQAHKFKEMIGKYRLRAEYNDGIYYGSSNTYSAYSSGRVDDNERIISLGSGFGKY
ncbi:MAG: methyl-accepting chemotaxis protein [Lachnospiraceae bacterium]|nr:methyl-accepting chemotaxis protein [Lachnospiraceae bacterium]